MCDNNSNNDYFIKTVNDKDDMLQINLSNDIGKTLLIKLICLIINYYKHPKNNPFIIIVKRGININIRKTILNFIKDSKLCKLRVFEPMMRSFVIVDQYVYEYLLHNNY